MDVLWEQFHAVARDGEEAWPALAGALHAALLPIARYQSIGRLRRKEDSAHEIVTRVLERLHKNDLLAVKRLCASEPAPSLSAWLRVIVRRCAIDYMRDDPEYLRAAVGKDDTWVSLVTLTSVAHGGEMDSLIEKRASLLSFMQSAVERAASEQEAYGEAAVGRLAIEWSVPRIHVRRLIDRGARYLQILATVLAGSNYREVARTLELSVREVELAVHYIEELLTARRFA